MLPPVLEIYVVWHPRDDRGQQIAQEFVDHFHGTVFSGLIGGAIEVYVRSSGWRSDTDAPRPIPIAADALPAVLRQAQFVAVVPILGNELASSVQQREGPWFEYVRQLAAAHAADPKRVGLFPYHLDRGVTDRTTLGEVLGGIQSIAATPARDEETDKSLRCRDLAQGIAQFLSDMDNKHLTVFISHTKRSSPTEEENIETLLALVRETINNTRLQDFFDEHDLQPGRNWDEELRNKAATSALLAIRTDLYPSREWCQREILIAKREGMPVVIMDAIGEGEERGSFLMDHVPRMPARMGGQRWSKADVYRGLNLLVDECLKRALWTRQEELARRELRLNIAWWAPHAPEPITLAKWLAGQKRNGGLKAEGADILILHPDPPLGTVEQSILQEIMSLSGINRKLDVMTPRLLAARGG